jgi:subtilisin-like proprotein convertase family protein
VKRLLLVAALLGAWAAPVPGATGQYSSGNLQAAIPDPGRLDDGIVVPDSGPVSNVSVSVRLDHPRDSDLTLALVSPRGTEVVLSRKRGYDGANYGRGPRSCLGDETVFEDGGIPIASDTAPFVGVYTPEERLAALRVEDARGLWTLRVTDDVTGKAGTLFCWSLTIGRRVQEHRQAAADGVRASLSYESEDDTARDARLQIRRKGVVRLDAPVGAIGRFGRPTGLVVRDLDADGEPEVLLDVFTGGAHCCVHSLIYRYDPTRHRYRLAVHDWGNVGYRIVDLDRNGQPELRSADDRFAYAFTSYAGSVFPVRIWHYRHGRLVDVTRSFPGLVRADAANAWRAYLSLRRTDPRGALAAWLADQCLLGRQDEGWRKVDAAYRRRELGPRAGLSGWPQGRAYLKALRSFLRKLGYART